MREVQQQEVNAFLQSPAERLLLSLKNNNSGDFDQLEPNEILRTAAIPEKLIVEEINKVPTEERLTKAVELGILDNPEGYTWSFWSQRPIVFTKVGGQKIPFYRSSEGTGGVKEAGQWYPFFGFGKDGWLIKGANDNHKDLYGNPALRKLQTILGQTFDWDHDLDLQYAVTKQHPFYGKPGQCPPEKINEILFGQKELPIKSDNGTNAPWIQNILNKMYERYSREFAGKIAEKNTQKLKNLGY